MAWALAESGGLLGGVHYLLTGVWRAWAVGALVLLAALILVPVPRRE
jgi:O-antigen ligase